MSGFMFVNWNFNKKHLTGVNKGWAEGKEKKRGFDRGGAHIQQDLVI